MCGCVCISCVLCMCSRLCACVSVWGSYVCRLGVLCSLQVHVLDRGFRSCLNRCYLASPLPLKGKPFSWSRTQNVCLTIRISSKPFSHGRSVNRDVSTLFGARPIFQGPENTHKHKGITVGNNPDRTSDNFRLQPHELWPHP